MMAAGVETGSGVDTTDAAQNSHAGCTAAARGRAAELGLGHRDGLGQGVGDHGRSWDERAVCFLAGHALASEVVGHVNVCCGARSSRAG